MCATSLDESPQQEGHFNDPHASSQSFYNPEAPYPEGDKYKIVRWNLLDHNDLGPRTIEFRQAVGTLGPHEIAYTMQFHAALIYAAARMAHQGTQTLPNEGPNGVADPSLASLLDLLQLHEEANQYWLGRAETECRRRVRDGREDKDLLQRQRCPACAEN